MKNITKRIKSLQLAQKKLLELLRHNNQTLDISDKIEVNPCDGFMTNISTTPLFHKDLIASKEKKSDVSIKELKEFVEIISRASYERYLTSKAGQQTIAKANKYNIPFDTSNIDFIDLIDQITDYEYLLERALELGVDWEESNYDIASLEKKLTIASGEAERIASSIGESRCRELRRDYYASIALY